MPGAVLKSIYPENVIQIIIKASAAEFIYSINVFNIFLCVRLDGCAWSMKIMFFERYLTLNIQTTFRLTKASLQQFLMETY